jgi:hypothetical protein
VLTDRSCIRSRFNVNVVFVVAEWTDLAGCPIPLKRGAGTARSLPLATITM